MPDLQNTPTTSPEQDDAPELADEFFERADEYVGTKLTRRGQLRPFSSGWQTRMNEVLKNWGARHT